jgi:hypothetical protein
VIALRAKVARLLWIVRRYGIRSAIRRVLATRRSPLFGLDAAQVGLAHVTRMDRSSARLTVHGRGFSDAARLECSAVVARHLAVIPVDVRRANGAFELDVPLQQLARLEGVAETQLVLTDGSKRWILGRAPQTELYDGGLMTVPLTVVALPGGTFIRFRVKSRPDGELRVVSEPLPGKVPA